MSRSDDRYRTLPEVEDAVADTLGDYTAQHDVPGIARAAFTRRDGWWVCDLDDTAYWAVVESHQGQA